MRLSPCAGLTTGSGWWKEEGKGRGLTLDICSEGVLRLGQCLLELPKPISRGWVDGLAPHRSHTLLPQSTTIAVLRLNSTLLSPLYRQVVFLLVTTGFDRTGPNLLAPRPL
jgi:hypothetical protein